MKTLWQRIVAWYDWRVYWLFWRTMNRMVRRNGGYAYLMQLQMEAWLKVHPLSPELKSATETFHKSLPQPEQTI